MTEEPSYTISKLAEAAGVTPRTIRYYTAEGLLPSPQTQGRYAAYGQAHLQRLRLIQRLKKAFLPLSTIRAQMESLSDAEVEALLESCPAPSEESGRPKVRVGVRASEPGAQQSQLDTIAQILAVTGQAVAEQADAEETQKPKRALLVSPALRLPESEPRAVWERILLHTGVELHVLTPQTQEERVRLERKIAAAKALFTEGNP